MERVLDIETGVQKDKALGTNAFFGLRVSFPLNGCQRECSHLHSRMSHRIVRDRSVVVGNVQQEEIVQERKEELCLNPNGEPLRVVYTNGVGGNQGSGTFEDPFTTFSDTLSFPLEDYDILYLTNEGEEGYKGGWFSVAECRSSTNYRVRVPSCD